MDIIKLSNGKLVANFSSPHPFTFTDDSVLPAKSNDEAERLKVTFIEKIDDDGDVELSFDLSDEVMNEIALYEWLHQQKQVDVVFCPLPMITALKGKGYNLKNSPFRSVRMEDRIKKLVSIEKQCL